MTRARRPTSLFALAGLLGLLGVGCIDKALVPPIRQGVDPTAKQAIYEDYKLTYDKGIFSENWVRRDGEYNLPELENVLGVYPETREVRQDILTRRIVIGTVGGVGAGMIAGTLSYNLASPADQQMSSSTQTALYVGGGGLFLASIIMQVAWHDPAEDLADIYNRALATDLGLAPNGRGLLPMPGGPGAPPPVYRASYLAPKFVLAPTVLAGPKGSVGPGVGAGIVF